MDPTPTTYPPLTRDQREGLRAAAVDLCRRTTPADVEGRPIYVVLASDLPADYQGRAMWGCAGPSMDLALREWIGSRWRGRGPCILLNDEAIVDHADVPLFGQFPSWWRIEDRFPYVRGQLLDVAVHEWAHHATGDFATPDVAPSEPRDAREWVRREIDNAAPTDDGPTAEIPFAGHDWFFLRAALHLAHRARAAGHNCRNGEVVNRFLYGLSWLDDYAAALGDEPTRMAGATFAAINATFPPLAFARLWQADTDKFLDKLDGDPARVAAVARRVAAMRLPTWYVAQPLTNGCPRCP